MQSIIHNLLKNDNINADILHLLCFAGFKAVNNAVDGCDIRGFLGNFGKNREEIAMIEQRLPEMFLMCTEGTTVGYEKKDNVVYPITQIIDYPKWQVEAIGKLQDGIKAFQKEYFKLIKLKPQIKEWCGYREELCKIFARLLSNPLLYEANFLGRIIFDQNNGVNELEPILNNDLLNKYKQEGMKNFYSKFASNNLEWYSGLNVCANPSVYYEMQLQRHRAYDLFSLILMTEQAIELAGNGKFILVGAGEHTRFILNFLVAVDKLSMVERIIDNNKNLHGVCLAGIEISEVEKVYESNIYLCTSLNKVIRDSFFLQISKILGENCNFISYFN